MKRRWAVIGGTAAAFAIAVFGMKFVPQQFFPNSSRPELIVELRMREGASFAATAEQVERMEAILAKDAELNRSPRTRAQGRRASISRSRPSCRIRAMQPSS